MSGMDFWIKAFALLIANTIIYVSFSYVAYFIWWLLNGTSSDPKPALISFIASVTTANQIIDVLNPGLTAEQERTIQLLRLQNYINSITS